MPCGEHENRVFPLNMHLKENQILFPLKFAFFLCRSARFLSLPTKIGGKYTDRVYRLSVEYVCAIWPINKFLYKISCIYCIQNESRCWNISSRILMIIFLQALC